MDQDEKNDLIELIKICIDDMIEVGVSNTFYKMPYINYKETKGKNRSPEIDNMVLRNGGKLGDPYCLYGIQDMLRNLERSYKFDFDLPRGGGTQKFFNETPKEYISLTPSPYSIAIYQLISDPTKGHAAWCLWPISGTKNIRTFEFNTSSVESGDVRDGEGSFLKIRNYQGFGGLRLRGFINIFEAII